MASPFDRVKRIASRITPDPVERVADRLIADPVSWLNENAPSLVSGATGYARMAGIVGLPVIGPYMAGANAVRNIATKGPRGLWDTVIEPLDTARDVGHDLLQEPISYGINRAIGIKESIGPFSGKENTALQAAAREIDNPVARGAAQAGLAGLALATDPAIYIPGNVAAGRGVLPGIANIAVGGLGNSNRVAPLASSVGTAFALGASADVGRQTVGRGLEAAGAPKPVADIAGSLLGGAAGVSALSRAGRARPGTVRAAVDDAATPGGGLRGAEAAATPFDDVVRAADSNLAPSPLERVQAIARQERAATVPVSAMDDAVLGAPPPPAPPAPPVRRGPPPGGAPPTPPRPPRPPREQPPLSINTARPNILRRVLNELWQPMNNAPADVREALTSHATTRREWAFRAMEASHQARVSGQALVAGVEINPATARRLLDDAFAAGGAARREQMQKLIGSVPDILEHPEDYVFRTPEATREFNDLAQQYADQLAREQSAGVWQFIQKQFQERADSWLNKREQYGRQLARVQERLQAEADRAAKPMRDEAGRWLRLAEQAEAAREQALQGIARPLRAGEARELERMAAHLAKVEDAVPDEMARRVAQRIEWATGAAEQATARAGQAGARGQTADARRMDSLAAALRKRAERAAAEAERRAGSARLAGQKRVERLQKRYEQAGQAADRWAKRVDKPVQDYAPHFWARPEDLIDGEYAPQMVTVGGRKGFQNERAYADYRAGVLDGATPVSLDAGDLLEARLHAGMAAVADRNLVDSLVLSMKSSDPLVVPDFALDSIAKAAGPEYAKRFRPLQGVALRLKGAHGAESALLDRLRAEAPLPAGLDEARRRALQGRINQGKVNFYIRDDAATALENALAPQTNFQGLIGRGVQQVFTGIREFILSLDAAMVGRLPMQTEGLLAMVNPGGLLGENHSVIARALTRSLRSASHDEFLRDELVQRAARSGLNIRRPGTGNAILEYAPKEGVMYRGAKAVVGRVAGDAAGVKAGELITAGERWQFERYVPEMMVNTWDVVQRQLVRTGKFDEAQAGRAAAKLVNNMNGAFDFQRAGLSRNRQAVERLVLLSPSWTRGALSLLPDVAKGGAEGYLARRFWVGNILTAVAISAGVSAVFNIDRYWNDPAALANLLDPRSDESVLNPNSPNFLKVDLGPLGGGIETTLWPVIRPVAKAVSAAPAAAIGEGVQEWQAAWDQGFAEAAKAGFAGALMTLAGQGQKDVRDWMWSRRSIPAGAIRDLVMNTDPRNRAIATSDDERVQAWQRFWYGVQQFTPAWAQQFIDTDTSAIASGVQSPKDVASKWAFGMFGLNTTNPSRDPSTVKAPVEALLKAQGIYAGDDPLATFRRASAQGDIDRETAARFLAQHPEVNDHIKAKRQDVAATRNRPLGKDAANLYSAGVLPLQTQRDQAIKAAGERHARLEISGDDYRRLVSNAWDAYFGGKVGVGAALGLGSTQTEIDAALDRAWRREQREPKHEVDRLLEQYQSIRPVDETSAELERMGAERRAFLESLSPEMRAKFQSERRSRALQVDPSGNYAAYIDAQDVMAQYTAIPSYLGVSADDSRRIARLVSQAQTWSRYMGYGTDGAELQIIKAAGVDSRTKVLALAALHRQLPSNPRRQMFLQQNRAVLSRYYSQLTGAMVESLSA